MSNDILFNPLFFDQEVKPRSIVKPVEPEIVKPLDQIIQKLDRPNNNTVLFEKYRPVTFNEIIGQDDIINKVKNKLNNLPHMILEGKAGIGKTTLVKVICNEINATLLELNSSDERGIDIIRGKVLNFIKHKAMDNSLKIVFFDEADSMTFDAQNSLKAIIEKYSTTTRFIFACNDIRKIIDPLKSRCKVFHFNEIDPDSMKKRLLEIIDNEHISISDYDLGIIIKDSEGDFRRALNELQTI